MTQETVGPIEETLSKINQMSEKVIELFDEQDMTAAEVLASIEIAKSVILVESFAQIISAVTARNFVEDLTAAVKPPKETVQ